MKEKYMLAHKYSSHHRKQIEKDSKCGCFFVWRFLALQKLWIGAMMKTLPSVLIAQLIQSLGRAQATRLQKSYFQKCIRCGFKKKRPKWSLF